MPDQVGLVLAGGGARGAYEIGVLSVLAPYLESRGERPRIIVGTSVGALNAAFLASKAHLPARQALDDGADVWRTITYANVLRPILSMGEAARLVTYLGGLAGLRIGSPASLLDTAPLERTVKRVIDFDQIARNVSDGALATAAVVATSYQSSQSVVFHQGGETPPTDRLRAIHYLPTTLTDAHVRASAAIPLAFPAVHIPGPADRVGWYCDGGTRLNTPIKPALSLGADRVVVIGLNSVASPPAAGYRLTDRSPDVFDGAVQFLQALLADPLAHDVATLATTNRNVAVDAAHQPEHSSPHPATAGGEAQAAEYAPRFRRIPYMFIAPPDRYGLGQLAADVYLRNYSGLRGARRSSDIALLGRIIDPGRSPVRGELFSYLFFAPEFIGAALDLGRRDAERWLASGHDDDGWQHHHVPYPS